MGLTIKHHGTHKAISTEVFQSAAKVAVQIALDLGLHKGHTDFYWAAFIADQNGGNWWWEDGDDMAYFGYCLYTEDFCDTEPLVGGIGLSDKLLVGGRPGHKAAKVFFHELAHRFMFSERYSDLWEPCWLGVERLLFHETVAICINHIYETARRQRLH